MLMYLVKMGFSLLCATKVTITLSHCSVWLRKTMTKKTSSQASKLRTTIEQPTNRLTQCEGLNGGVECRATNLAKSKDKGNDMAQN